jgi:hypothetical protein
MAFELYFLFMLWLFKLGFARAIFGYLLSSLDNRDREREKERQREPFHKE